MFSNMKGSSCVFLSISVILNCLNFTLCSNNPVVSTSSGTLKGSVLKTWTNKNIFSFRGIPFVEPPIGNLRFKAPIPVKPWQGVRNAIEDGKICPQVDKSFGSNEENCLFLNVYSKNLKGNQPVIVFFHPGAFVRFAGASYWFGPDYLLDHDVVLVTVNYRLDALGFLSTGDREVSGNNGLKDQVEALRWIKKNIKNFGGNPESITITGYCAGSTSVLLHLFSPMTKGLFHRVIAMSSGFTADWVIIKDPLKRAQKLAGLLNCQSNSTEHMIKCLRNFSADDLISKFTQMRVFGQQPAIVFGAVIESDVGNGEERFLTDYPVNLIKKKQFHQVPVVTGITEHVFLGVGFDILNNVNLTLRLNNEFDTLLPTLLAYWYKKNDEVKKITSSLREFYFGSGPITSAHKVPLGNLYSDSSMIYSVYSSAKLLAKYSDKPVYFYKFDYEGRYGWYVDTTTNMTVGPSHHDELIYLFPITKKFPKLTKNDPEAFMIDIQTSYWYNFITTEDPTPAGVNFKWTPLTHDNKKYLIFDKKLKMEDDFPPFAKRMELWESLFPVL